MSNFIQSLAAASVRGPAVVPAPATPSSLPAWVSALPLWQWYEIPDTKLSLAPRAVTVTPGDPAAKITAWTGASIKRDGSVYILGPNGGHADYAGNEINALRLNTETPTWEELRPSSAQADIYNLSPIYRDGRPAAQHTYWASHFIDSLNRHVVFCRGGISYPQFPEPPVDWPYEVTDAYSKSFNLTTGDYDPPEFIQKNPGGNSTDSALCFKHGGTEDVYLSCNYNSAAGWMRWTKATNTWVRLSGVSASPWYSGAACDPIRNRVLAVGGFNGNELPRLLDLNGGDVSGATFGGPLGGDGLRCGGYPGVEYDEANDAFIVLFNTGGVIETRVCDAATLAVSDPGVTGTKPATRVSGICGSAKYVPELRGIVIANVYTQDVKFLRTAP